MLKHYQPNYAHIMFGLSGKYRNRNNEKQLQPVCEMFLRESINHNIATNNGTIAF